MNGPADPYQTQEERDWQERIARARHTHQAVRGTPTEGTNQTVGPALTITVKPLEWRIASVGDDNPLPDSWPVYHGSFADRVQVIVVGAGMERFMLALPDRNGCFATLEEAQAAGQREWDAFIRAAITVS